MRTYVSGPISIAGSKAAQIPQRCEPDFTPASFRDGLSRQPSSAGIRPQSDRTKYMSSANCDSSPSSFELGTPKSTACATPISATPISTTPLDYSPSRFSYTRETETSVVPISVQSKELKRTTMLLQKYLAKEPTARHGFLGATDAGGISPLLRAEILVWLKELIAFHECESDVYVCAAELLDQLLSATKIKSKHLRVAAVSCFLIASKCLLEEADQPLVSDLVANCDSEFSENDLRRMETVVLSKIQWQLPTRSSISMLHNLIRFMVGELLLAEDSLHEMIAILTPKYASCTVSYELTRFQPSAVAASLLVSELVKHTRLSATYLREVLESELGITTAIIESCSILVSRHLHVTASVFTA